MNVKCPKCGHEFKFNFPGGTRIHIVSPGSVILCPSCSEQFILDPIAVSESQKARQKNQTAGFWEKSLLNIVVGLTVKILLLSGYLYTVKLLSPIDLLSPTAAVLALTAVFLWFFEIEGGFISEIINSRILLYYQNKDKVVIAQEPESKSDRPKNN